jgi:glycosyltransferase involved in cell wall biosynthesis
MENNEQTRYRVCSPMSEHVGLPKQDSINGISVLIATRNRAEVLRRTLEDFCTLLDPGVPWEILIVDNGSSDDTRAVVESFKDRLPIRYLYEGEPGKVHALNSGIPQTRFDFILMTDDDVTPCEEWLCAYAEAAISHPECSFFGGDIYGDASGVVLPRWARQPDGKPLDWLVWNVRINPNPDLWSFAGGNIAYRSVLFSKYGLFPAYLGHVDGKVAGGEEPWFQSRLRAGGEWPWYVPDAWVRHRLRQGEFTIRHWLLRGWHSNVAGAQVFYDSNPYKLRLARAIVQGVRRAASVIAYMVKAALGRDQGEVIYQAVQLSGVLAQIATFSRLILAPRAR